MTQTMKKITKESSGITAVPGVEYGSEVEDVEFNLWSVVVVRMRIYLK